MTGVPESLADRMRRLSRLGPGELARRDPFELHSDNGEVPALPGDLSDAIDDFVRLIVAMHRIDTGDHGGHWDAERAGYLALGRLRRSLNRACAARGLG